MSLDVTILISPMPVPGLPVATFSIACFVTDFSSRGNRPNVGTEQSSFARFGSGLLVRVIEPPI